MLLEDSKRNKDIKYHIAMLHILHTMQLIKDPNEIIDALTQQHSDYRERVR